MFDKYKTNISTHAYWRIKDTLLLFLGYTFVGLKVPDTDKIVNIYSKYNTK